MSTAIELTTATQAMRKLDNTFKWGTSAEHPGLGDVASATAHRMGDVLELIRDTQRSAIAELRESNVLAAAEAEEPQ